MATRVPVQDGKGDLARLLATEERLEQLVVGARAEAERVVAAAQAQAAAREAALAAQLDAEVRKMTEAVAAERSRREAELAATLRAEAARFDAIPGARIAELAGYVVRRVIGSGEMP